MFEQHITLLLRAKQSTRRGGGRIAGRDVGERSEEITKLNQHAAQEDLMRYEWMQKDLDECGGVEARTAEGRSHRACNEKISHQHHYGALPKDPFTERVVRDDDVQDDDVPEIEDPEAVVAAVATAAAAAATAAAASTAAAATSAAAAAAAAAPSSAAAAPAAGPGVAVSLTQAGPHTVPLCRLP